MKVIIK